MRVGFYCTVVRGRRVGYLVGPCASEPEARALLEQARAEAGRIDPWTDFDAFGTAKVTAAQLRPGVLNERIGFQP